MSRFLSKANSEMNFVIYCNCRGSFMEAVIGKGGKMTPSQRSKAAMNKFSPKKQPYGRVLGDKSPIKTKK